MTQQLLVFRGRARLARRLGWNPLSAF